MKRRRVFGELVPLDALVDIVSSNVGVLLILGACAVLLTVLRPFRGALPPGRAAPHGTAAPVSSAAPRQETAAPVRPAPAGEIRTLKVPWVHATSKNPVFAALIAGRVKLLDLTPVYEELLKRPSPRRPKPVDVRLRDATIRFYPVTNEVYCFQLRPDEGAGETVEAATLAGSAWTRERGRFDAERTFYFFWVASDSFEQFRALRNDLRSAGVEVGWKPVRAGAPLELCQGVDGGSNLVPQ